MGAHQGDAGAVDLAVVVDGEIKGYGQSTLNIVPVDQIESITVMKDKTALAVFGDKVKDAAVIVTTKKNEYEAKVVVNERTGQTL